MTVTTSGLTFTRRLGAGGEAEVYEVAERPGMACKRYRRPTAERAAKLRVMLAAPPEGAPRGRSPGGGGEHVAIAWPTELVVGSGGVVEGFLMPRIDLTATVPLFQMYNPSSRVQIAPAFTWRYLLRTARNVAAIVASLHRAGYVVGDINESNLLVNRRALAVLVDCDSMQVRDPVGGVLHRGGVGKPEFTAPELQGHDLSTVDRTPASDDFAVAVLVFQLLLEGVHPFAGVWRGSGDPPDVPTRMRHGDFPYRRGGRSAPPPRALGLDVLPPELRRLAWRTFTAGVRRPAARPSSAEWAAALERSDAVLRACDRSEHHVFGTHRRRCPWCERIDAGLPDPFPGATGTSSLTRRPPPPIVRVRRASASAGRAAASAAGGVMRSVASAAGRGVRRVAVAVAAWVWSRVRTPVAWTLPAAIVLAASAALAPAVAACLGTSVALTAVHGRQRARSGAASRPGLAMRWWARGRASWRRGAALATGSGRWAALVWSVALTAVGVLALHGPWWWPLS